MKDFKELTIPLQRRRIIKDALAQIEKGVIVPANHGYLNLIDDTFTTERPKSFKTLLRQGRETCEACAKGSLFAACVYNVNRVNTGDIRLDDEPFQKNKLKKWFSVKELDSIEAAFERKIITDDEYVLKDSTTGKKTDLGKNAIKFGRQFSNPKGRLVAILNNILENKTFTP